MKKNYLFAVAMMYAFTSGNLWAAKPASKIVDDSTKVVKLKEISIVASRATDKTPIAFTNVTAKDLEKVNVGQDLPYLLASTPSLITTSDAGTGIGYTSMRVRGTDLTRINVTNNGIPINDAESHSVYWVNMPDIASSLKDVQVQRGAGTSTNGAGAFGASINMVTDNSGYNPYASFNGSYGMYNSHKETLKLGTGLINNHWSFDARLSNIGTDGYIDRASVDLYSYHAQAAYYNKNTSLRLISYGGKEKTYHAWNYASKEEMEKYGRTYNSCGRYKDENGNVLFYDNQTDNYTQFNFQLLLTQRLSDVLNLNAALHYTKGDGYYEEYKTNRSFKKYGLTPYEYNGALISSSDLIQQKKMKNNFGGFTASLNYKKGIVDANFGGAYSYYDGDHFGQIKWIKNYIGALLPDQEFYRNNGKKSDANIYARANVDIIKGLSAFADVQYRHIDYKIVGKNDNYTSSALENLDVHQKFDFLNPKAGLNWRINAFNRLFASFAVAQKEPTRSNYTDGKESVLPSAEKLFDYELGYSFNRGMFSAGANLYYMDYTDQLVPTGELSDTGKALSVNVPDSYRMGVELMFGLTPCNWFSWNINGTLSRNRIKDYKEVVYDGDESNPIIIDYKSTPIAFSPDFILNNNFTFMWKGLTASIQSQYVSKQYMSNVKSDDQALDAYFVSNLHLAYTFKVPSLKSVQVGLSIYNLFNEKYENNGYAGAYYSVVDGQNVVSRYAGYAAQAPTNVMGSIAINF